MPFAIYQHKREKLPRALTKARDERSGETKWGGIVLCMWCLRCFIYEFHQHGQAPPAVKQNPKTCEIKVLVRFPFSPSLFRTFSGRVGGRMKNMRKLVCVVKMNRHVCDCEALDCRSAEEEKWFFLGRCDLNSDLFFFFEKIWAFEIKKLFKLNPWQINIAKLLIR